jgi:hypothetical protein
MEDTPQAQAENAACRCMPSVFVLFCVGARMATHQSTRRRQRPPHGMHCTALRMCAVAAAGGDGGRTWNLRLTSSGSDSASLMFAVSGCCGNPIDGPDWPIPHGGGVPTPLYSTAQRHTRVEPPLHRHGHCHGRLLFSTRGTDVQYPRPSCTSRRWGAYGSVLREGRVSDG